MAVTRKFFTPSPYMKVIWTSGSISRYDQMLSSILSAGTAWSSVNLVSQQSFSGLWRRSEKAGGWGGWGWGVVGGEHHTTDI
jgi:hypothetical protein